MAKHFDVVIVDEAAQAVEPSVMVPLVMGCKQVSMCVFMVLLSCYFVIFLVIFVCYFVLLWWQARQ